MPKTGAVTILPIIQEENEIYKLAFKDRDFQFRTLNFWARMREHQLYKNVEVG